MGKNLFGQWAHRTGDIVAVVLAAALMVVSAAVHLHLWDIAYRHVATLGPLFLVQAATAIVAALALVVTRMAIVMIGSVLLMLGTIVGFFLALTVGLFGFTLPSNDVTQWAYLALSTELASALILMVVLIRHARSARPIVAS